MRDKQCYYSCSYSSPTRLRPAIKAHFRSSLHSYVRWLCWFCKHLTFARSASLQFLPTMALANTLCIHAMVHARCPHHMNNILKVWIQSLQCYFIDLRHHRRCHWQSIGLQMTCVQVICMQGPEGFVRSIEHMHIRADGQQCMHIRSQQKLFTIS